MPGDASSGTCTGTGVELREVETPGFQAQVHLDRTNGRLKVTAYRGPDWTALTGYLDRTASEAGLGKILFNVRESDGEVLAGFGYVKEGTIPAFFSGETALCFSRFVDPARAVSPYLAEEDRILAQIAKSSPSPAKPLPGGFSLARLGPDDAGRLARLYARVFESYPTPLLDPAYIRSIIASHVVFCGVLAGGALVGAASAEVSEEHRNAELTDCATLPEYRGQGILTHLIEELEETMWRRGLGVLYSLARAGSYGMNAVLQRRGYEYRGRFLNNCHIGGRLEDMNLWVRQKPSE